MLKPKLPIEDPYTPGISGENYEYDELTAKMGMETPETIMDFMLRESKLDNKTKTLIKSILTSSMKIEKTLQKPEILKEVIKSVIKHLKQTEVIDQEEIEDEISNKIAKLATHPNFRKAA